VFHNFSFPYYNPIVKLRFTIDTRAAGIRALIAACQNLRFWQLPSARGLALLVGEVFFWRQSRQKNGFY
jgi:hypothetical protein